MSSSEEDENEERDRFRRERFDEYTDSEEKKDSERKRRREEHKREENRSGGDKRRKLNETSKAYREISFFDKHWKSEWFQKMFNPIERKRFQKKREENAKHATMEFKNDVFNLDSKRPDQSILILGDVPEEISSETCKEWILKKLKDEKNLLRNIVFSNPLKRGGFERYALLHCENESALNSVQRTLNGEKMSFKSIALDNRESFRRVIVEKFIVNPVPKVILPTTMRSHERLMLDLHQALFLSDALDHLRNLDFTLRKYLERHNLPSADPSDGFQTLRMLDISTEWLLRVHRWGYYNNCSFEEDGDMILARNERRVRPQNTSETDELKTVVVRPVDYKDVDVSKFDQRFMDLMKSLDKSAVSDREFKWDALEKDFVKIKKSNNEENKEESLRRIIFQAFSSLCHGKDKIMALEYSATRRHDHDHRGGRNNHGDVKVPAPYFQRQHNGKMRFKDPDAVSSSSPLLSLSSQRKNGKSTPKKMDFDEF